MKENDSKVASAASVNPHYAGSQLAKALVAAETGEGAQTQDGARNKVAAWTKVLQNIVGGALDYGSRTPIKEVPAWATLEVVKGGFATGELLAAGALQDHEKALLERLDSVPAGQERRALNAYFLTDAGLQELGWQLESGCYDIKVPEEGALLVLAWLVENGHVQEARQLLDQIAPYFGRLRFYPIPLEQAHPTGPRVHLQDVSATLGKLRKIKPKKQILLQREAVNVWGPFCDRMVSLFLETAKGDWPCQYYPVDWPARVMELLEEYAELRLRHTLCARPDDPREHFAQLRQFLGRSATAPASLSGKEVGRIRVILARHVAKRGAPGSPRGLDIRRKQSEDVRAPTFDRMAQVVLPRLGKFPGDKGLDDVEDLLESVSAEEASQHGIPEGTRIPESIRRKIDRCLNETVAALTQRELITSGEVLAQLLPQMTSEIRAMGMGESRSRRLYAAVYRAFRRRRSLLLLNLESQVRIEELPWIAAIESFRGADSSGSDLSGRALEEISLLALTSFPQAILPNKLLKELRALAKGADMDLPLVDELAADIFMGEFSEKFAEAARWAARLLDGTLYSIYYDIDYGAVQQLPGAVQKTQRTSQPASGAREPDAFAEICRKRAGVPSGARAPASNGMVIEQQQILTTQNLATLFSVPGLKQGLQEHLGQMAMDCFKWICKRQQVKSAGWHGQLLMLKNTAYAWRQMIVFLALLPKSDLEDFMSWAQSHLEAQPPEFRTRFGPVLTSLMAASKSSLPEGRAADAMGPHRFLGWSKERHWLLGSAPA